MKERKINKPTLKKLLDGDLSKKLGVYVYSTYRIHISMNRLTTSQRVKALYHRRRKNNECIMCGAKVKKVNKMTGRKYRLCEKHREIDRLKRK